MNYFKVTSVKVRGVDTYTKGSSICVQDAVKVDKTFIKDGTPTTANLIMNSPDTLARASLVCDADNIVYRIDNIAGSIVGFNKYLLTEAGTI